MSALDSLELTRTDALRLLSPVGCLAEALSAGLLFTAIAGCFVAAAV
ncbi:hypothetical protein ACFQJD_12260 [Haloplanus sp. GCM10025708]